MSQQINLYRARFQPVNDLLPARRLIAVVLAAMLLSIGSFGWNAWRIAGLQADSLSAREALSRTQATLGDLSRAVAARRGDPELRLDVARAEALQRARGELMALLGSGTLGTPGGFSEPLRAFARQREPGVVLTGFTLAGGSIELKGRAQAAELVPAYLQRLGREKSLSGMKLGRLTISGPDQADPPAAGTRTPATVEFAMASEPFPSTPAPLR